MPRRKIVFATGEVYHIFNRSIAKEEVFASKYELNTALEVVNFYRFPQKLRLSKFKLLNQEVKKAYIDSLKNTDPLVEIYAFSFMPNHYHFLLKQLQDNGIPKFVSNFQNSFAKIFNLKRSRNGAVFQSQFKAKRPETDEEFLHISRYIHLNPVTAYLIKFDELANYPWTSFRFYNYGNGVSLVNTKTLIGISSSRESYLKFVANQVDYQKTLDEIKHFILE